MTQYSGYITDINELYIFATAVDTFCNTFKNACHDIASSVGEDYSLAFRQLMRIKEWMDKCAAYVDQLKREYDTYTSNESYDRNVAESIKRQLRDAKEELQRARCDYQLAEQLFRELRSELDQIHSTANKHAYSVGMLGDNAVNAIRAAADFISSEYNS